MKIISGQNVDLITPFPEAEVPRIFGWKHCYRTLPEDDDAPQEREEFLQGVREVLPYSFHAGVIDKQRVTSTRHEAPLVGICMFIPSGRRDGLLHFAVGRRAFRAGLMQEALAFFITEVFDSFPELLRMTVVLDESNSPAKSLLRKEGFKFEGVARDAVMAQGVPRSRVSFGLTRQDCITLIMSIPDSYGVVGTSTQETANAAGCE